MIMNDKSKEKILIQQQQKQIQDLEVDNSNLSDENLQWQDKYGDLQTKYVSLKHAYEAKRKS